MDNSQDERMVLSSLLLDNVLLNTAGKVNVKLPDNSHWPEMTFAEYCKTVGVDLRVSINLFILMYKYK